MHKFQKRILKLAESEDISQYGYRKLGEFVGIDHPQKVKWHLNKLFNDGHLVKRGDGSISIADEDTGFGRMAKVPILGLANCGEPLSFADNTQHGYLTLSPSLIKSTNLSNLFAVQATGDSMNNCSVNGQSIDDGDYVIVDSSVEMPHNGEYVVSSLEGLANIKKFIKDDLNQVIALVSESTRPRPPIVIDANDAQAYKVHGRVIQVVKSYA